MLSNQIIILMQCKLLSASPQEHRQYRKEREQTYSWCKSRWFPVSQMQGLEDIPTGYCWHYRVEPNGPDS